MRTAALGRLKKAQLLTRHFFFKLKLLFLRLCEIPRHPHPCFVSRSYTRKNIRASMLTRPDVHAVFRLLSESVRTA